MKLIKLVAALALYSASNVYAAYTGNVTSAVDWVKIYNNDTVYFKLADQPATQCGKDYFTLSSSLNDDQRNRYYSMLLAAKAAGIKLTVGYDSNAADCYQDRPLVHAISVQ